MDERHEKKMKKEKKKKTCNWMEKAGNLKEGEE